MIVVENKTNYETTKKLNKFQLKKLLPILFVIFGIFVFIGFIFIVGKESTEDVVIGVMFLFIGVGYIPLVVLFTNVISKSRYNSSSMLLREVDNHFEFEEKGFKLIQKNGDKFHDEMNCSYELFACVFETKNDFYLFITQVQVFVVEKTNMKKEDVEKLSEILKNNLKDKYKLKNWD